MYVDDAVNAYYMIMKTLEKYKNKNELTILLASHNMKEVEINGVKQRMGGALTKDAYRSTFRLGSFIATQFKPLVAKTIYTMTKAEWRADKNRAFSKAYNMLMKGDLDGLIIAKMASGKDIYGESREVVFLLFVKS